MAPSSKQGGGCCTRLLPWVGRWSTFSHVAQESKALTVACVFHFFVFVEKQKKIKKMRRSGWESDTSRDTAIVLKLLSGKYNSRSKW